MSACSTRPPENARARRAVLIDALEIPAEMIVRVIDGLAQQALQAVPGGEDLPQRPLVGDAAIAVDRDALRHLDAKILGAGAARFQRIEQFRMRR